MPFHPICIFCLADCDAEGKFSSCHHFFCSRCAQRIIASPDFQIFCPLCRKRCRFVDLKSSAIQPFLRDANVTLQHSTKLVCNQIFHYEQVIARMRVALNTLHGKVQALQEQVQQKDLVLMPASRQNPEREDQFFSMAHDFGVDQPASMHAMSSTPLDPITAVTPRIRSFQTHNRPQGVRSLQRLECQQMNHTNSSALGWQARVLGGKSERQQELEPGGWTESHSFKRRRSGAASSLNCQNLPRVCPKAIPLDSYSVPRSHTLITPHLCSNALRLEKNPPLDLTTPVAKSSAFGENQKQHSLSLHTTNINGAPKLLQGLFSRTS